jgi:hypothetical protein
MDPKTKISRDDAVERLAQLEGENIHEQLADRWACGDLKALKDAYYDHYDVRPKITDDYEKEDEDKDRLHGDTVIERVEQSVREQAEERLALLEDDELEAEYETAIGVAVEIVDEE